MGMQIVLQKCCQRDHSPIPRSQLSTDFRRLGDAELRTTALDVVAIRDVL